MRRRDLFETIWILEVVLGLAPAIFTVLAGMASYAVLLPVLPALITDPQTSAMRRISLITVMLVGGILGLTGIAMALQPRTLRGRPKLKATALAFALMGILAEVCYVVEEGWTSVTSSVFSLWVLLGPLFVGVHCLYRLIHMTHDAVD